MRARDVWAFGLEDPRGAPVHGPPRADAPQYGATARSVTPCRRCVAGVALITAAARPWPAAGADAAAARRTRLSGDLVGCGARSHRVGDSGRGAGARRLLS